MRMQSWRRYIGALLMAALLAAGSLPQPASAQIVTRPRPAASYLHGPFVLLHMTIDVTNMQNGHLVAQVEYRTVRDRAAIARLVRLMNMARTYTVPIEPCTGGGPPATPVPGPVWLTFIRANGTKQHATFLDPCNGYEVHGIRLREHTATIWRVILTLIGGLG